MNLTRTIPWTKPNNEVADIKWATTKEVSQEIRNKINAKKAPSIEKTETKRIVKITNIITGLLDLNMCHTYGKQRKQ